MVMRIATTPSLKVSSRALCMASGEGRKDVAGLSRSSADTGHEGKRAV